MSLIKDYWEGDSKGEEDVFELIISHAGASVTLVPANVIVAELLQKAL